MEGITRLVSESLVRHGFDRPLDYRRLHWSRWYRCESPHSLLFVPSKPGVFALAEEIGPASTNGGDTASWERHDYSRANPDSYQGTASAVPQQPVEMNTALAAAGARRVLAVSQFFQADDMAFVLDRMLSNQNPMRARLISGHYFVRYVAIEDECQRRSVCSALNQWIAGASEQISGIGAHFATSLELTDVRVGRTLLSADAHNAPAQASGARATTSSATAPQLDSGAATNIHCPAPFPSGF